MLIKSPSSVLRVRFLRADLIFRECPALFEAADVNDLAVARELEEKRKLGTRVHAATVMIDDGDFDEDHAKTKFPEILPYLVSSRFSPQDPKAYKEYRGCSLP